MSAYHRGVAGAVGCALLTVLSTAVAEEPANKYRKIANDTGNCIFSTKPLEVRKEDAYTDVRTRFDSAEMLQSRCYFARKLKDFESKGKVYNGLRDDHEILGTLTVREAATRGKHLDFPINIKHSEKSGEWDSIRFTLDSTAPACSWKGTAQDQAPNGCLDVPKVMRQVAAMNEGKPPWQGEVCLTAYFRFAEQTKKVLDAEHNAWVDRPDLVIQNLATSCVTFTVK